MLFYDLTTKGIGGSDRAIVGPLRPSVASLRKAQRETRFRIPQEILLFETKPEVIVIVVDPGPAIGDMGCAIGVEHFSHHQVPVFS